jgi:hypothetical protein
MHIDFKSARIDVDISGSAPATDISSDGHHAVLHLTRNANPVIDADPKANDIDKSAISIQGSVDVHHNPGDDISQLGEFRFIQLAYVAGDYALYAGARPNDGFVDYNWAAPPAFPQKFAYDFNLDAAPESYGPGVLPFQNDRAQVIFPKMNNKGQTIPGISSVVNAMDDHPCLRMRVGIVNNKTNGPCLVAELLQEMYFLSAFVVRDKRMKITILAHVCWRALWNARYHWVANKCIPYRPVAGTFDFEKPIKGPPIGNTWGKTGSSIAAKITNPTTNPDETANALARSALKNVGDHPLWWNRFYGEKRPSRVPSDFWRAS